MGLIISTPFYPLLIIRIIPCGTWIYNKQAWWRVEVKDIKKAWIPHVRSE
jgi:hypothetical protein